jgi:hypothetical protein
MAINHDTFRRAAHGLPARPVAAAALTLAQRFP